MLISFDSYVVLSYSRTEICIAKKDEFYLCIDHAVILGMKIEDLIYISNF